MSSLLLELIVFTVAKFQTETTLAKVHVGYYCALFRVHGDERGFELPHRLHKRLPLR